MTVAARITDRGKGIGRIEWRVNGVTAGVRTAPAGPGPDYEVKQELALDPGENQIEVIAYEGRNLLASLPARTTITYDGPADTVKPKLYILAIGINDYEDARLGAARQLRQAGVSPAQLVRAGRQGFRRRNGKGRRGAICASPRYPGAGCGRHGGQIGRDVRKLASEISPRDTFVLYAAAHGYSVGGNYYMIPQDYQGGPNPAGAQGPRHRPGAAAGLDRQPHQGEEGADPARHLRIRRADRRLYEVAHGRAGFGGGGWAAA